MLCEVMLIRVKIFRVRRQLMVRVVKVSKDNGKGNERRYVTG